MKEIIQFIDSISIINVTIVVLIIIALRCAFEKPPYDKRK